VARGLASLPSWVLEQQAAATGHMIARMEEWLVHGMPVAFMDQAGLA
jgi:hypothetical protein